MVSAVKPQGPAVSMTCIACGPSRGWRADEYKTNKKTGKVTCERKWICQKCKCRTPYCPSPSRIRERCERLALIKGVPVGEQPGLNDSHLELLAAIFERAVEDICLARDWFLASAVKSLKNATGENRRKLEDRRSDALRNGRKALAWLCANERGTHRITSRDIAEHAGTDHETLKERTIAQLLDGTIRLPKPAIDDQKMRDYELQVRSRRSACARMFSYFKADNRIGASA